MSHFSVLVIGPDPTRQLAPYHEFECTGVDNEYVKDVDRTEEFRASYLEATETRLRGPDGELHSYFDEKGEYRAEFSKPDPEAPQWNKDRRIGFLPEGFEEVEVPAREIKTFAEYITDYAGLKVVPFGHALDRKEAHKFGWIDVDVNGEVVRAIDRTNPNAKWDWHALGGRYNGRFRLKSGRVGIKGEPGVYESLGSKAPPPAGRVDQALKRDIDFASMRDEAEVKARAQHSRFYAALGTAAFPKTWQAVREAHGDDIAAARTAYHDQPGIKAVRATEEFTGWFDDIAEEFGCTEDEYAQLCRDRAIAAFAVVIDSKWYERGRMGWFACVSDEKDERQWYRETAKLIAEADDNTLFSLFDCHI